MYHLTLLREFHYFPESIQRITRNNPIIMQQGTHSQFWKFPISQGTLITQRLFCLTTHKELDT